MSAKAEVVRAIYAAWRDGRSARDYIDEDVEYVNPPDAVEPGIRRGRKSFAAIRNSYDDVRVEPLEYIDAPGDDVVVVARLSGRGRISGLPVEWRQGYVWTVRDGVAVRFRWFNRPEQALEAARIGASERIDGPVLLAEADPSWAQTFDEEAARIRAALGDAAELVEHVGSTSVPELAAKPVIDIVLAVPDSTDEAAYVPALERAGYMFQLREPDWHEHRLLKRASPRVNLHVFTTGSSEIERMIKFRDRLRSDPDTRKRYEDAKRELAAKTWRYVQDYADAKTETIEAILAENPAPSAETA